MAASRYRCTDVGPRSVDSVPGMAATHAVRAADRAPPPRHPEAGRPARRGVRRVATAWCRTCRSSSAWPAPAPQPGVVRLAGLAGLIAGAVSMAAGEYVSMRAQAELFERELDIERRELERSPHVETVELAQDLRARGRAAEPGPALAEEMMRDPDLALETHAREELGIDPGSLGSPWWAAVSSFLAFTVGALIPLLPWLFGSGDAAVVGSVVLGAIGALGVGVALARLHRPVTRALGPAPAAHRRRRRHGHVPGRSGSGRRCRLSRPLLTTEPSRRRAGTRPPTAGSGGTVGSGTRRSSAASGVDEKTLAILSHLGAILGGFVLPLVMFLVAKDKPYVRHHVGEALNFAITYFVVILARDGGVLRRSSAAGGISGEPRRRLRDLPAGLGMLADLRGHRRRHRLRSSARSRRPTWSGGATRSTSAS